MSEADYRLLLKELDEVKEYLDSVGSPELIESDVFGNIPISIKSRLDAAVSMLVRDAEVNECKRCGLAVIEPSTYLIEKIKNHGCEDECFDFISEMILWYVDHVGKTISEDKTPLNPADFLKKQNEIDARIRQEKLMRQQYANSMSTKVYEVALEALAELSGLIGQSVSTETDELLRELALRIASKGLEE